MLRLKAFSKGDRKSAAEVVKKAMNSDRWDKYKDKMSDLCHRGLALSYEGARGGYSLTDVGRSIAEMLAEPGRARPAKRPSSPRRLPATDHARKSQPR